MALSVTGAQVESVLRRLLPQQGYVLHNLPRGRGETGADIIAKKHGRITAIECIGFQEVPPLRSKQFYEAFFRAVSRLNDGAHECIMALPMRFGRGMNRRARHYGVAWKRIAEAFPELQIWLVDTDRWAYEAHHWGDWPFEASTSPRLTKKTRIGSHIAESKHYAGGPHVYWWDVWDSRTEAVERAGHLVLVQKDTGQRTVIPSERLLSLLTEDRRTTRMKAVRGKGNWGLKVRQGRPNEIEVEGGKKGKPAFIRVKWCEASCEHHRESER